MHNARRTNQIARRDRGVVDDEEMSTLRAEREYKQRAPEQLDIQKRERDRIGVRDCARI